MAATLLAPYQNAMRLGQGFNSYTQQIRINNAVKVTDRKAGNTITDNGDGTLKNRSSSQIVTYSSRHVDKLSDVSDSMNISGSLAIKCGTIQGSGPGAFVDTNRFRESDMNFLLQVKVINQTPILEEESYEFQKIENLPSSKFADVFGDCFISGFLEGGEFNALISIKVLDKSRMKDIKAATSLALSVGGVGIEAKGEVAIKNAEIAQSTETTVSVSWCGGGVLKKPDEVWNISTVTATASRFADLVAQTPQRKSAILTRYTSLRSFVLVQKDISPLNYENTGVYTADLLNAYMDYKLHWKNINIMLDDPSTYVQNPDAIVIPSEMRDSQKTDVSLYGPTAFSLTRAHTFCRQQMINIVNEVDAIAKDPTIASKEGKLPYQSPDIFRARLPVAKQSAVSTKHTRRKSAFAALRLDGYKQIHLYYLDTAGNLRVSVAVIDAGNQAGDFKDGGIVEEAKNVAANTPIAATSLFSSGTKPRVIFFNKEWQLCERAMDDGGVWSNGCVTGTTLTIEPAPYSQLAFASGRTDGGMSWIFYQGNDQEIVECYYQADMVFCQDGSGRGVFRPALAGTPLTANWARLCRFFYQTEAGMHEEYFRGLSDGIWRLGDYNATRIVFPHGTSLSSVGGMEYYPGSGASPVIRCYGMDPGWRIVETVLRRREGPLDWKYSMFVPVLEASPGTQSAAVAWNDNVGASAACVRVYVHNRDGMIQEWLKTGDCRFEPGAVPPLL